MNVVFSVDLFNEGIDVPAVDTLLILRPTDSPTLFLQQLGRGLRRRPDKTICTVLDFVGHHRQEFRFDRRFRALLGGSRKDLERRSTQGFPFLPAGCHMELDRVARDIVLAEHPRGGAVAVACEGRRAAARSRVATRRSRSPSFSRNRPRARGRLGGRQDLVGPARRRRSATPPTGPKEDVAATARATAPAHRRLVRIDAYRRLLADDRAAESGDSLPLESWRLLRMLVASVADHAIDKSTSLEDACKLLWAHPQVRVELLDLLDVLAERRQPRAARLVDAS